MHDIIVVGYTMRKHFITYIISRMPGNRSRKSWATKCL